MPRVNDIYNSPPELVLGKRLNQRVPEEDQKRQRREVDEILHRLRSQPGVILADEVGMGKTFVALAVAYSVAVRSPLGPIIVMVPANLVDKWEQDLNTFCELYLENRQPIRKEGSTKKDLTSPTAIRYGVVRHSVELMKLLDDPRPERCHIIFLSHGAMGRRQTDKWVRLALIAEALRRHGRGKASRLIEVKKQIHRFLAKLLWAIGEERAHEWGEELWQSLLQTDPEFWKDIYNKALRDDESCLPDDPVPKSVIRTLQRIDLATLAEALKEMPIRARGGDSRIDERLDDARKALRKVEEELWRILLSQARWRSPLLVMDEAHHLKNPGTSLARHLQSKDLDQDLRTGDGAMAHVFDRMLFLTATPFQLGHRELLRVLERFGDVRWDANELGSKESFLQKLSDLHKSLDEAQRTTITLQRSWSRLQLEDINGDIEEWWDRLLKLERDKLTPRQRAVVDSYETAKRHRDDAEKKLLPWLLRHNKGYHWAGTNITRRKRIDGGSIVGLEASGGLQIPPQQLLPFFLAARSAVNPKKDLLGEALCSSYEAFRFTRQKRDVEKDEQNEKPEGAVDLSHSQWYLNEFDRALGLCTGSTHPKVYATVQKAVDLWEKGEKVLVFAFYRYTCRALRVHISQEIEKRIMATGERRLNEAGRDGNREEIERLLERIQNRYFDDSNSPGRRAIDAALNEIMRIREPSLDRAQISPEQRIILIDIMRRFLRVSTTLVRCFPIAEMDSIKPPEAVRRTLDYVDSSKMSWRQKFDVFIEFLTARCSRAERELYLEAAQRTQTGGIRVEDDEGEDSDVHVGRLTLANVQVATGATHRDTRARLMRAFNTPFFPDILVCSEVMGEGVDLQRFCCHVIHHDLDWNPSSIEQRTGRIDRLGCKAEGHQAIVLYLPYLAGAADERQFRVMSEREQWFRMVMGQDEVAQLITPESGNILPLPNAIPDKLSFKLGLDMAKGGLRYGN